MLRLRSSARLPPPPTISFEPNRGMKVRFIKEGQIGVCTVLSIPLELHFKPRAVNSLLLNLRKKSTQKRRNLLSPTNSIFTKKVFMQNFKNTDQTCDRYR